MAKNEKPTTASMTVDEAVTGKKPSEALIDLPDPETALVTSEDMGDAETRSDTLTMVQSWLGPIVPEFIGGALPPLFAEEPRVNENRIVIWTGYMVIEAEHTGLDNDFVQLNFDVLNPRNGKVIGKAGLPLGAVSMRTFKAEQVERTITDSKGKPKTVKSYTVGAIPNGDVLAVTYGGETESKKNQNPAKLFMFERIATAATLKAKQDAGR